MNEHVVPDYSIPLTMTNSDREFVLDPRYDFIRLFTFLGYGIINIVTETGIARVYVDQEQCEKDHEHAGLPMVELEWICESEYESMHEVMAQPDNLEDWINL